MLSLLQAKASCVCLPCGQFTRGLELGIAGVWPLILVQRGRQGAADGQWPLTGIEDPWWKEDF